MKKLNCNMGAKATFCVILAFLAGVSFGIGYAYDIFADKIGEMAKIILDAVGMSYLSNEVGMAIEQKFREETDVESYYFTGIILGLIALGLAAWIKEG